MELDQLRAEIAALRDLLAQARRVRDHANDSKLTALRECLAKAEFNELKDGRGRLLIFTEHRDTLNHLLDHLNRWGYSTCQIHGGMNPHERKRAQEDFRTSRQICVATEAAGEGINLQFCRLMINYDLPCRSEAPFGTDEKALGGTEEGKGSLTILGPNDADSDGLSPAGRGRQYEGSIPAFITVQCQTQPDQFGEGSPCWATVKLEMLLIAVERAQKQHGPISRIRACKAFRRHFAWRDLDRAL